MNLPCCNDTSTPLTQTEARARQLTEEKLAKVASEGPPAIERRLAELDAEWSAGRLAKVAAAVLILAGFALGYFLDPWWYLLPAAVGVLLLHHSFTRASPLSWGFRQAGFRYSTEIEHERCALKALRGDFRDVPTVVEKADTDAIERMEGEGGPPSGPEPELAPAHAEGNRAAANQALDSVKR